MVMKYDAYQKIRSKHKTTKTDCTQPSGGLIFADGEISGQFTLEEFQAEQRKLEKRKRLKRFFKFIF